MAEKAFDILKHELVPEQTILSDEEKKQLLQQYNITARQLPKTIASDSVVKALGAKPGDVIKITRNSPTAGKTLYYRIVIKV